ncbi:MCE family protein [Sphingomonas sp. CL5.1]|uniref:MlaD family protein n=1 Tax=Sphingomonas sp. CL5.1 TaxID=2653203 RepID=UPI001581977D|nr:MlaD family protein [Sphingomonas sp. CL5.1]QKR99284.1 MCE family protein [Sphingomonas sp. CL5.1]
METTSNRLLVFAAVGVLLLSLVTFSIWLHSASNPTGRDYLIRFKDSVSGIRIGSSVSYSGVPVGSVTSVRLTVNDPSTVLVTIRLDPEVPILHGVTASISRSLVGGGAAISLDGSLKGASTIVAVNGEALPVIPAKNGGLLGSGGDPMAMVEKISRTIDKVSTNFDARGQQRARDRLAALADSSSAWSSRAARISDSLTGARGRILRVGTSIASAGEGADRLRAKINGQQGDAFSSADEKLRRVQRGIVAFDRSVSAARPSIRAIDAKGKAITGRVRSVRAKTRGIADQAEQIDRIGLQVGAPRLPDYKRGKRSVRPPSAPPPTQ